MRALNFIGIENQTLSECSERERLGYRFFNFVQLGLVLLVAWEIFYLVEIIFENRWWAALAGAFWAFVFFNIYRVILFTISGKRGETLRERIQVILLNAFKVSIVIFFALMISIPLRLFVNETYIAQRLPEVIEGKVDEVRQSVNAIYTEREQVLNKRLHYYEDQLLTLNQSIANQQEKIKHEEREDVKIAIAENVVELRQQYQHKQRVFQPVIQEYQSRLQSLKQEQEIELESYVEMIKASNLLSERFSILVRHKPVSGFLFTLLVIGLFLSPLGYKLYSLYVLNDEYEAIAQKKRRNEIYANQIDFNKRYQDVTYHSVGKRLLPPFKI